MLLQLWLDAIEETRELAEHNNVVVRDIHQCLENLHQGFNFC